MGIKEILNKPAATITVIIVVLIVGLLGGFFACYKTIGESLMVKNATLEAEKIVILNQSKIEIDAIKEGAEIEKQKAEIEISNLPADAVVIRFLTDDEIIGRTNYTDGIAKQIIDHSLQFFREMGIHFATTNSADVERRIQSGNSESTAGLDGL